MTEQAYDQPKSVDDFGPIRQIGGCIDKALDAMEKSIASLQARLQPVLRENDQIHSVPSAGREEMGTSPLARTYQEQLRRIDQMTSRIQELTSDCTI